MHASLWRILTATTCLTACVFAASSPALAQSSQPASDSQEEDRAVDLEESLQELEDSTIIVTATRRAALISDVPLSISALGEEALERSNAVSLEDVQTLTPSLNLGGRSVVRPQISIRGIGTPQFTNAIDSPVGVFIDDVPIARFSSFYAPFNEVERVEVLRGPQGTLFGRNTIAGAISIVSKAPSNDVTANVEASVGNFDLRAISASVSGPIAEDKLFFRLASSSRERDGFTQNLFLGNDAGGDNTTNLFGRLRFTPDDSWTFDFTADYSTTDASGEASEPSDRDQPLLFPAPGVTYDLGPTEDPFTFFSDIEPRLFRDQFGLALRSEYENDSFSFVSITSYRDSETGTFQDNDGTELRILNQNEVETSEAFTQELRLVSVPGGAFTFDDRLEWLLGAFYLNEQTTRESTFLFGDDSIFNFIAATSGFPPFVDAVADGELVDRVENEIETDSFALFGNLTFALTDQLSIGGGLRYSRDEKTANYIGSTETPGIPPTLAPFEVLDFGDTFDSVDFDVTLDYDVTDDLLLYGRYATGYKSGGFQPVPSSAEAAAQVVDQEDLVAIELGLKADLFQGDLRLRLAVFDYDYEGLQLTQIVTLPQGGASALISNAEEVSNRGIEIEGQATPLSGWNVTFGYTYLDTEFVDFEAVIPGSGSVNIGGETLPRAPEHQVTFSSAYTVALSDRFDMTFAGDIAWQDETNLLIGGNFVLPNVQPSPNIEEDYALVNASLRIEDAQSGFYVQIFARNLFDEVYRTSINVIGDTPSVDYFGAPRTYGVTLGWEL